MTPFRIAAVMLAAGRGTRFGGDKLRAELAGIPVAHHAASSLATMPFFARIAVVSDQTPNLTEFGFQPVMLAPQGAPLSRSIALGVAAAEAKGGDAVLIALADMPLVPVSHFEALIASFDGDRIATACGTVMPPAMFGARHFRDLTALEGGIGARALLHEAPCVDLGPQFAIDIDTPQDLDRAREITIDKPLVI